jgi:hypothetical protein
MMGTAELKIDLHTKIDHADNLQLKELYGLVTNYLNSNTDVEDWHELSQVQQKALLKGIEEADAGLGNPLIKINERLRNKYGING